MANYVYIKASADGLWGLYVEESALDRARLFRERRPSILPNYCAACRSRRCECRDEPRQPAPRQQVQAQQPKAAEAEKPKETTVEKRDRLYRTLSRISEKEDDFRRLELLLGIPDWVFSYFEVRREWRWDNDYCYWYPEFDSEGRLTSFVARFPDGQKRAYGPRGIVYPSDLEDLLENAEAIYLPEGWSDCLALRAMFLPAIGRPSSTSGIETLAAFLAKLLARYPHLKIVIIGENDRKEDGSWPGKAGAIKSAGKLATLLGRPVQVYFPPDGAKDTRAWWIGEYYEDHKKSPRRKRPDEPVSEIGRRFVAGLVHEAEIQPQQSPGPARGSDGASAIQVPDGVRQQALRLAEEDARRRQEAEAALAAEIGASRRNFRDFPCHTLTKLVMRMTTTGAPVVVMRRCSKWTCEGCRLWLIDRELRSLGSHLSRESQLFEGYCPPAQWSARKRQLQRARAKFHRTFDEAAKCWYVVATREFCGSIPATRVTALATVEHLLDRWHGDERPCSASHSWRLPKGELTGEYELVGKAGSGLNARRIEEIAKEFGAQTIDSHSSKDPFFRKVHLYKPEGWSREDSDHACFCLMVGEWIPKPEPVQPTEVDDGVTVITAWNGTITYCFSD